MDGDAVGTPMLGRREGVLASSSDEPAGDRYTYAVTPTVFLINRFSSQHESAPQRDADHRALHQP